MVCNDFKPKMKSNASALRTNSLGCCSRKGHWGTKVQPVQQNIIDKRENVFKK